MYKHWALKLVFGLASMELYLGLYSGQVSASTTTYSTTPTSLRGTWYYNDGKGWYTRVRVTKTTVSQVNQRSGLVVSLKSSRVKLAKPNKYGYWRVNIKGYRPIVLKSTIQNGERAVKGRFAGKAFSTGKPVFAYHYLPNRLPEEQWTNVPTQFQGSWGAESFHNKHSDYVAFRFGKYTFQGIERTHPGVFFSFILLGQAQDPMDHHKSSLIFYSRVYRNITYWIFGYRSSKFVSWNNDPLFAIRRVVHKKKSAILLDGNEGYFYKE
ncbi:hypothetical protein [Lentilactobacillus otakiensis]|uniref:hypothetical protein n=1 Tax=Lentilactobacillus otakiensis TaxID=481720 RepID=UPI003D169AF0